jgi:mRNA interferase MazF
LILAPITAELRDLPGFRIPVAPSSENGLREPFEIMVDKLFSLPRDKVEGRIGTLDAATRTSLDRALSVVLGLV